MRQVWRDELSDMAAAREEMRREISERAKQIREMEKLADEAEKRVKVANEERKKVEELARMNASISSERLFTSSSDNSEETRGEDDLTSSLSVEKNQSS